MSERVRGMSARTKNTLFGIWFGLDAVLALLPPLYWAAGNGSVAWSYVYFLGTGALIVASIVALYAVEAVRGEVDEIPIEPDDNANGAPR